MLMLLQDIITQCYTWVLDAWLAIHNTVCILMKDNKVAFPKYSHWTKYLNVKKYSPGSTDFPSHKDGIPSLLFLCCDIVQTTHPFWASVSLCSSFLEPSPKPHPPHTFFCPTPAGLTLPPHGCYACCSLCPLAFSQFSPTWHLSSFKSQFKHHFLREASLQARPGPMLPLKTTLHCIYHSCRCICIWVMISFVLISSSGLSAPEKRGCLYSSLNPKKLNIVEARLMCVGWRNKISQSMDI